MHGQPVEQQSTIRQLKVHNSLAYVIIQYDKLYNDNRVPGITHSNKNKRTIIIQDYSTI